MVVSGVCTFVCKSTYSADCIINSFLRYGCCCVAFAVLDFFKSCLSIFGLLLVFFRIAVFCIFDYSVSRINSILYTTVINVPVIICMSCISSYINSSFCIILIDCIKCDYFCLESGSNFTVYKVVIILFACCFAVLISIFVNAMCYSKNELCFCISLFKLCNSCVKLCFGIVNFVLVCFSLT